MIYCCRFLATDLEYIINHAKDEYIMLDVAYLGLVEQLHQHLPCVKRYIVLADKQDMPANTSLHNVFCYEDWLQVLCTILSPARSCLW